MTVDDVVKLLNGGGLEVKSRQRLGNDKGTQIRCKSGQIVNVFDNGTVSCQGKNPGQTDELLGISGRDGPEPSAGASRSVFVVYGHDSQAVTALEAMLRRWNLEPQILGQLPSEGQTLIEKLERYTGSDVAFAVVLATPDDEGYERGKPDEARFRARQNVVLELGLLLAKLGRQRVAILLKDQEQMERPSDIQGLIYIPFRDSVEDAKVLLAKEMQRQGLAIDLARL